MDPSEIRLYVQFGLGAAVVRKADVLALGARVEAASSRGETLDERPSVGIVTGYLVRDNGHIVYLVAFGDPYTSEEGHFYDFELQSHDG